ncbi:MAG: hypothetical protein MUF47_12565 [Porphyrobacter sp.]|jgi:hypothetical protein|nr:hypothetical protein [Porphyrobacter sp.]
MIAPDIAEFHLARAATALANIRRGAAAADLITARAARADDAMRAFADAQLAGLARADELARETLHDALTALGLDPVALKGAL